MQTRLSQTELDHAIRYEHSPKSLNVVYHKQACKVHGRALLSLSTPELASGSNISWRQPLFCPTHEYVRLGIILMLADCIPVTEPDSSRPVFVLARQDCGRILLPEYVGLLSTISFISPKRNHSGTPLELEKGHISLLPHSTVEHLIIRGEAELV